MTIFTRDRRNLGDSPQSLVPPRMPGRRGRSSITSKAAMQQSVIWASTSLPAAIESMMPVNIYRMVDGRKAVVATPPVLVSPSSFADGHPDSISDWLYARRKTLGGWGNNFGEVTALDAYGLPAQVQLVPIEDVTCRVKDYRIVEYRFGRRVVEPRKVWHDRENLMPGNPIGLSPIAQSMMAASTSAAAAEFIAEWFGSNAFPGGHMKHTSKALNDNQTRSVKAKFAQTQEAGGLLVTGSEWTFTPIQAKAAESGWLDFMGYSDLQLCRMFNMPANMIDVATTGSARIVYANITQANLDYMVTRMGPGLKRTDDALSSLLPRPRFAKLTREAFLAMDPVTRADLMKTKIDARLDTPDHLREIDDLPPLTEADYTQFDRLFGSKVTTPQKAAS